MNIDTMEFEEIIPISAISDACEDLIINELKNLPKS